MKNIEYIKRSICNTINSLPEEELRQLIISCREYRKNEGLLSIGALYGCDECSKTFGDCEDYGFEPPCKERFHDYCKLEIPESENKIS